MRSFALLGALASLASLAAADGAPYPIFQSFYGAARQSMIANDVQSFLAMQTGAAYSSAKAALASATNPAVQDVARQFHGNPNDLADDYASAAATPTWFSALPSQVQAYVTSVAAQQAAIASSDAAKSVADSAPSDAAVNSILAMASASAAFAANGPTTTSTKNAAPVETARVGVLGAFAAGAAGAIMI